jgi:GNAT superfamily N-acetyltransferase
MGATEASAIVQLDASEAAAALALSTEAHWNQNEADWLFFLRHGIVYGIRNHGGRLVATAALLPHSATEAWVSMVLVTADHRRRGLATRLVDQCLATAAEMKLTTWLDATPAGATVYGPLGFEPVLELRRLRRQSSPPTSSVSTLEPSLEEFIRRDREALGFERSKRLGEFYARGGSKLVSNGAAAALIRDGRTARHVGPVYADRTDPALALMDAIMAEEHAAVLIDAVASQTSFLDELVARGFTLERPFQRMRFGAPARALTPPTMLAVAGPEFG